MKDCGWSNIESECLWWLSQRLHIQPVPDRESMTVWGFIKAGSNYSNSQTESENLINPSITPDTHKHIFWEDKHIPGGRESTEKQTHKKTATYPSKHATLVCHNMRKMPQMQTQMAEQMQLSSIFIKFKRFGLWVERQAKVKTRREPSTKCKSRERESHEESYTTGIKNPRRQSQRKTTNWQTKKEGHTGEYKSTRQVDFKLKAFVP